MTPVEHSFDLPYDRHALSPAEEASQASQLEAEIKYLSERERRSFFRSQEKAAQDKGDTGTAKESRKINKGEELDEEEAESGDDCDERTAGTSTL